MSSHSRPRIIVAAIAVAVLAAVSGGTAILGAQPEATHSDSLVAELERQLGSADAPEVRASLAEKLQIARESQDQERAAQSAPADWAGLQKKAADLRAASEAIEARPTVTMPRQSAGSGYIVEGLQPPFPAAVFLGRNQWFREDGKGTREVAWAGSQGSNSDQGTIVLIIRDAAGARVEGFYPTPTSHGAVRVSAATGDVLDIEADDGTRWEFDVSLRAYR